MEERPLDVKDQTDAKNKIADAVIIGNTDHWQCLTKFSAKSIGVMHSTKAWEIPGKGVLIQCSSEIKGQVAMSLEFISGVKVIEDINGGKTLASL